ncbi:autotransporter outer membrane beta-barrel domain-containing protein [Achromobacter pulmonis]|uniref:autotransporter outer membrane beta-barrel domain-containing protein n=1 Tax=Achromobacter pulmonis TaxID=1389932 RepID=UPI0015817E02|nr:autotransporter outer membrane beta-barrel domain-containing protein [Achromobacter pulmonis]
MQAQLVRTEGDIHSATTGSPLIKNNRGLGHAASIEAGMPLALTPHWRITPQAQLLYSKIRFDPFTDPYGARVASTQGKDTRLRLGLDLAYRPDGSDTHSPQRGLAYHGGLNLYRTLRGSKTVGITNEQFSSAVERTLAGLDIGAHYTRDDRISAYAEISAQTGLDRPGANYALSGRLGLRMLW